jgi:hypothetical protein
VLCANFARLQFVVQVSLSAFQMLFVLQVLVGREVRILPSSVLWKMMRSLADEVKVSKKWWSRLRI